MISNANVKLIKPIKISAVGRSNARSNTVSAINTVYYFIPKSNLHVCALGGLSD